MEESAKPKFAYLKNDLHRAEVLKLAAPAVLDETYDLESWATVFFWLSDTSNINIKLDPESPRVGVTFKKGSKYKNIGSLEKLSFMFNPNEGMWVPCKEYTLKAGPIKKSSSKKIYEISEETFLVSK
jgi:hypothetical protein